MGQDWYQTEGSSCSGSTTLNAGASTFLPKALTLQSIAGAGNFAVKLLPTELAMYLATNPYTFAQVTLDKPAATSLKAVFNAATVKIPFIAKLTNAFLLNYALGDAPANVAAGVLFDWFYENVDAEPTSIDTASGYVAEGGQLSRTISVRKAPKGGRFLLSQLAYSVQLGAEMRQFVLGACQFPVAMWVSEFQTAGPFNNKIIKPKGGNTWGVFDIDDGKWDSLTLEYVQQDVDYYSFEADETDGNGNVIGKTSHRLSLTGGPWSRKRSDSATYSNFYLNVNAK